MFKFTWKIWLAVWLGITAVTAGLYLMLSAQGAPQLAYWLAFAGSVVNNLWVGYALYRWREVFWVRRLNTLVLTTLGFGFVAMLFLAVGWETGRNTTVYLYFAVTGFCWASTCFGCSYTRATRSSASRARCSKKRCAWVSR